jgi:DNA-binding protein HU-beta
MTKFELISKTAEKAGITKAAAEKVVEAVIETLREAISKGERVAIPGLGVFNVKERKAKKGRDLRTGKEITIPAKKAVVFTAAKSLKEAVNKK